MSGLHFDVSVGMADLWGNFLFINRGKPRDGMCMLSDHPI